MTTYATEIIYCTETHDYAMYLGGELVGFARTYDDADKTLAELTADLTSGALLQPPYAALLDDQSADHQPLHIGTGHYIRLEIDPCEVCDEPATVTVRISREPTPLRLCRDCYSTMWDNNEEITVSWEADFDPEPQPPYTALLDAAGSPEPDPPPPVPPGQGGDDPERGPYSDEEWAADCAAAHALGSGPPVWWELLAASPIAPDASPFQSPPAGGDAASAAGPCDVSNCGQPGTTVWLGRWPAYPVRLCRAHKAVA